MAFSGGREPLRYVCDTGHASQAGLPAQSEEYCRVYVSRTSNNTEPLKIFDIYLLPY